ncbi:GGDEF domain-containing protein [Ferviditalea candida]|uniref:EAL domain-containing protein n=1 Tax=Ferviditalea candida TaxID=3108399 RepID=A0ABU5ZDD4_9BACL|nr:EAL domain-containing protein [Paenibacillaceae bacterium T2]
MIRLRSFELQFMEEISNRLEKGNVGLIYLDITRFSQVGERYGRIVCEHILLTMRSIIADMIRDNPRIMFPKMVGDDIFLYVVLPSTDEAECMYDLRQIQSAIKLKVEEELRSAHPVEPEIEIQVGQAMLQDSADRELETIIYSSMKQAIRNARLHSIDREHALHNQEYMSIIQNRSIYSVYQPIISFADASVFGYEVLTRGPDGSFFHPPATLFKYAQREGSIYILERMAREKAIQGSAAIKPEQRIFINISADILHDPQFAPGNTLKLLEEHGLSPKNVVFEITERSSYDDFSSVKQILKHYRKQGYQIAIDDAGSGYSSLQAIAELQPDFIKVDRSLIHGIHQDKIKEYILETFVTFAQKMNISIIAEGIEQKEDLIKLVGMGIHYGQGFLLGMPQNRLLEEPSPETVSGVLSGTVKNAFCGDACRVGDIVVSVKTFESSTNVSEVVEFFRKNETEQGAVIIQDQVPIGLIMREKLFQKLAEQYGMVLYWHKPIQLIMDKHPLVVDESMMVENASQMAIAREIRNLYDLVIVTSKGRIKGAATVRAILECITNEKMEKARVSNPLTGLPGNMQIEKELSRRIATNESCAVIYADLDFFKWYNDRYGFQKGDGVIRYTADIIQNSVGLHGRPGDFVGHIGGDDFIIICGSERPDRICEEIIERFEQGIHSFYDDIDLITVLDRSGNPVSDHMGVTVSLSVIRCSNAGCATVESISQAAAELKKKAKLHRGSVFLEKTLDP